MAMLLEDTWVMEEIAWQFPPQGETCLCDEPLLNKRTEHPSCLHQSILSTDWDLCMSIMETLPPPAKLLPQRVLTAVELRLEALNKPFLSLMLPEWVHEKAAEDEMSGAFRCESLASFTSTPATSAASSPENASRAGPFVRRSAVCWADLAESDDDHESDARIQCASSGASTATSSPVMMNTTGAPKDRSQIATFNALEYSTQAGDAKASAIQSLDGKQMGSRITTGMRWADLVESDRDPLHYKWSSTEATGTALQTIVT
jgi:hypothetical protein